MLKFLSAVRHFNRHFNLKKPYDHDNLFRIRKFHHMKQISMLCLFFNLSSLSSTYHHFTKVTSTCGAYSLKNRCLRNEFILRVAKLTTDNSRIDETIIVIV